MADIALRLEGVSRFFGTVKAVDNLSIDIPSGAFVSLLGPSGCGKSTTLNLIAGLDRLDEGRILLGDQDITETPPNERRMAMVFQNYALYPHLTAYDNIAFGLKLQHRPKDEIRTRVNAVAEALDIAHLMKRKPGQLSGGQQQRVALGRAMAKDPLVFLLDEPFSNLDAGLRSRMRTEVKHLHLKLGTTSVFVTHDQEEAMSLSDLIAVMRDGKVVQLGTAREVYRNPRDLYVATFVGKPKMSLVDGALERSNGEVMFVSPDLRIGLGSAAELGLQDGRLAERRARHPRRGRAPQRRSERASGRQLRGLDPAAGADRFGYLRRAGVRRCHGRRQGRARCPPRDRPGGPGDADAGAHPPVRPRTRAADHPLNAGDRVATPDADDASRALVGRVALVTGGAGGIGRAIAGALAADGATVIVADRDGPEPRPSRPGLDGARAHEIDLTDTAACRAMVEDVLARDQRLDILVNAAGFQHIAAVVDYPMETWDAMLATMLTAPFVLSQAVLPAMYERGWGRIVNIGSIHSVVASPNKIGYVAAKHGLLGLTRAIAIEAGAHGVTCNAVCPAYVRTPLVEAQIADQAATAGIPEQEVVDRIMLAGASIPRLLEADEVAAYVRFLCSDAAGGITGSAQMIDGGWTAR